MAEALGFPETACMTSVGMCLCVGLGKALLCVQQELCRQWWAAGVRAVGSAGSADPLLQLKIP